MTARGQLTNIQALRAAAILLVVVRHIQVYMARRTGGSPALGHFLVGDMGVDLFFVISGFIMVVARPLPCTGTAQVAEFLSRRVTRIYPLYWLYSLPALAVYFWRPGWLHRFDAGMRVDLLRSFFLWPQEGWPLLGQAWSLVYEMYFYLVFAALLRLRAKWFGCGLLAWTALVLAGGGLRTALPALDGPGMRVLASMLTLEFIAGGLAGLAVGRMRDRPPPWWGWLLVGCAAAWIVGMVAPLGEHLGVGRRTFVYGPPALALVLGAVLLERAGTRTPRFLAAVGDWSYSIYLSHIFVIAALARLVSPDGIRHPATETLSCAVCLGAVLLSGAVSYHLLERPLLRLTRQWLAAWFLRPARRVVTAPRPPAMKRRLLILTPTLGTSPYLDETVRSIDQLDWPVDHVLVCPAHRITELAARFPGRRIVADAGRGGGLYGALNAGLRAAADLDWGWFTYLNDDDLLTPGFAVLLARHDDGGAPASVGYGDVRTVGGDGGSLGCMTVESNPRYFPALLQGGISPLGQQGMVFGAPVVRALGGYDGSYSVCADLDFWVRAYVRGFAFRYYPLEVGGFRVRQGQISGAVSLLREQMADITRRHFPAPLPTAAKRFARWRYRCRNLPRYVARLRVVGFARSLDVLQAGGRRAAAKREPSPAGSTP